MADAAKKLLLIDDDNAFRKLLALFLQKKGYTVDEADNGPDGIEKVRVFKPDLVLLDVEMPKMSGVEVLKKIKSDPGLEQFKVTFLTNYGEDDPQMQWVDKKFAKEIGAVSHIRKDADLGVMLKSIEALL